MTMPHWITEYTAPTSDIHIVKGSEFHQPGRPMIITLFIYFLLWTDIIYSQPTMKSPGLLIFAQI